MPDRVIVRGLAVAARVGVTARERRVPQRLEIDAVLECDFRAAGDEIARTADYAAVAGLLRDECAKGECCLLEALAERLAVRLLVEFPCAAAVELELHKDVLVHARSAGVALRRVRGA